MNDKKVSIWLAKDGNYCVQLEGEATVWVYQHLPPAMRKVKDLLLGEA